MHYWTPNGLSKNITNYIVNNNQEFINKKDEIRHGLEWLISGLLQFTTVITLSLVLGIWREALICFFSGAILRMFSGGAHLSNYFKCLFFSSFYILLLAKLSQMFVSKINIVLFCLVTIPICIYCTLKNAPVLHKKKCLFNHNQRILLKLTSMLILLTYLILCLYMLPQKYILCVWLSSLFQSFTITKIGEKIINYIDQYL